MIILLALMCIVGAKAQEGEIIYTDFEPDSVRRFTRAGQEAFFIDMDNDSIFDFHFETFIESQLAYCFWIDVYVNWDILDYRRCQEVGYGDTLTINNVNRHGADFSAYYPNAEDTKYMGFRFIHGDDNYYGWLEMQIDWDTISPIKWPILPTLTLTRMAYCTIPNYPLRAGQTSLTDGIGETEATAFAIVFPNPTNGLVTIAGNDLKQAQVINALGQCVATIKGEGEQLTVDISDLPAGVYFVNITDGEGRKCVRKVVKE